MAMTTTAIPPLTIDDLDTVTISGAGAGASGSTLISSGAGSYNWTGTGMAGTWTTTTTIPWNTTGNVTITSGSTYSTNPYVYATTNGPRPVISLDVEHGKPLLKTEHNEINIDELADMLKLMKQLLAAVASDEEFAKRNPALAEAAYDMMIKKLKD